MLAVQFCGKTSFFPRKALTNAQPVTQGICPEFWDLADPLATPQNPEWKKMPSQKPSPPKIRYEKQEGFQIFPVSGAFGGPTPKGDTILCQFFLEYLEPPEIVPFEEVPGRPGAFRDVQPPVEKGVRYLQTGIFLSPQQALAIGDWLIKHAETIVGPRKGTGNA